MSMMNRPRLRPGAVVAIDLVRSSQRSSEQRRTVLAALRETIDRALRQVRVDDALINHTGDGYVCALLGDCSSRLVDFLNHCIPALRKSLEQHGQQFRCGVDYGLLLLTPSSLTATSEHFDQPGIFASRLEGAAEANTVLCSETVCSIFRPQHPGAFSSSSRVVKTKDGELCAFEFHSVDSIDGIDVLSAYLLTTTAQSAVLENPHVLVVDDEADVREFMRNVLEDEGWKVSLATNGRDALAMIAEQRFDIIALDIAMPGMSGTELARAIMEVAPSQAMIAVTGGDAINEELLANGIFEILWKPIDVDELLTTVRFSLCETAVRYRAYVRELEYPPGLLGMLQSSRRCAAVLLSKAGPGLVCSLIRHKVKHVIFELARLDPADEAVVEVASSLLVQLEALRHFSAAVDASGGGSLSEYIDGYLRDLKTVNPGLVLEATISPGVVERWEDHKSALALVVTELVDNAVAALHGKGCVRVSAAILTHLGRLLVQVEDNGPGISAELVGRLFQQGASTKGRGRGMGLALIKAVVDRMQGTISYEKGDGAKFTLMLPIRA